MSADSGDHKQKAESRFGELAIESGLVTREQLEECLDIQQELAREGSPLRLGEVFVREKILTREQALDLLKKTRMALGLNARIGGYELLEKIGQGGMGAVYRARQLSMDREVALKLLPRALSKDPKALERFLREARTVAGFNHPNIVRGFEVGEANGYHYFAMEYIDGGSLRARLKEDGPFSEKDVVMIGIEMATALAHAHDASVIHRDVKPSNIMASSTGFMKLSDLGLAVRGDDIAASEDGETPSAISAGKGRALGTPYYMSPEQARGDGDPDPRTDIYSLGATLFHLVTGFPPFTGDSVQVIIARRLIEDAPDPAKLKIGVSTAFASCIRKMLERERDDRYSNCREIIADLTRVRDGIAPLYQKHYYPGPLSAEAVTKSFGSLVKGGKVFPEWMTVPLLCTALVILFAGSGALWVLRNHEHWAAPHHPTRLREDWSSAPKPMSRIDSEAKSKWASVREVFADEKISHADRIKALYEIINDFPSSPEAALATDIKKAMEEE